MKLEDQVCSLELAQKLKELGVKQESLFIWSYYPHVDSYHPMPEFNQLNDGEEQNGLNISAFTVAELGEMLPFSIKFQKHICYLTCEKNIPDYGGWICKYESSDIIRPTEATEIFTANTEADARAKMLIYLMENKLITL